MLSVCVRAAELSLVSCAPCETVTVSSDMQPCTVMPNAPVWRALVEI